MRAPIVNAVVAISMAKLWDGIRWQFMLGILLAAVGGTLVTFYKPNPHPPKKAPPASASTGLKELQNYKVT